MKTILLKLIGGAFVALSALLTLSTVFALFNGGAQSIKTLLLMPLHLGTVIENPLGALAIAAQAGIQIFILWGIYRLGRKIYCISEKPKEGPTQPNSDHKDIRT